VRVCGLRKRLSCSLGLRLSYPVQDAGVAHSRIPALFFLLRFPCLAPQPQRLDPIDPDQLSSLSSSEGVDAGGVGDAGGDAAGASFFMTQEDDYE
jgi:hypothetical protein